MLQTSSSLRSMLMTPPLIKYSLLQFWQIRTPSVICLLQQISCKFIKNSSLSMRFYWVIIASSGIGLTSAHYRSLSVNLKASMSSFSINLYIRGLEYSMSESSLYISTVVAITFNGKLFWVQPFLLHIMMLWVINFIVFLCLIL